MFYFYIWSAYFNIINAFNQGLKGRKNRIIQIFESRTSRILMSSVDFSLAKKERRTDAPV